MLRYSCNSYYSRIFYLADLQDGARFHLCGCFAIAIHQFAGLGTVGQSYIRRGIGHVLKSGSQDLPLALTIVYQGRGYMDLVSRAAEQSMQSAVEEVQARPDYAEKGEVRHVRVHACFTVV